MATYNAIDPSRKDNDLVEGTESGDSIYSSGDNSTINANGGDDFVEVYGNFSVVNAGSGKDIVSLNGGSHNGGIWLDGEESNEVYGGNGNDSIYVASRGASIYGEGGNDTINIDSSHIYANGGAGNDVFYYYNHGWSSSNGKDHITITGGAGNDKFILEGETPKLQAVITDFSNDDVFRFNRTTYANAYSYYTSGDGTRNDGRTLTQHVENGNVVISDNVSISSSGGNTLRKDVEPNLSITLQGVSDISQVANAKYYLYNGDTPMKQSTLGELFGVQATATTSTEDTQTSTTTATTPTTTTTTTTSTKTTTTTTTEETTTTSVTGGENNNGGTVVNNYNYYGDTYNLNDNNGAVVIGSSVTGGVTNTTNIDNSKNIVISGNTWTYSGGDKVINNYQQGEVVRLDSDYQGIDLNGNSFFVKSSSGSLEIENARDKFIGYSAGNDEVAVYSYVAGMSGAVDGRDKAQAEIMIGAENSDNQIYAGSGGSSLYGGVGGNDELFGGDGYDEFFYAMGGGSDVIQNAGDNDVVNLLGVSLSQISYAEVNQSDINIGFNDGGNLKLQGQAATGFMLEGVTYTAERSTGTWHTK